MIRIAQYRGVSLISRLIRWQTRSPWSHTAAVLNDDSVVEAWYRSGVVRSNKGDLVANLSALHTPGTTVDLFRLPDLCRNEKAFERALLAELGKPYDFQAVFRFLTRRPYRQNRRWFCSELVASKLYTACRVRLQRNINSWEISPHLVGISPLLEYERTIITTEEGQG